MIPVNSNTHINAKDACMPVSSTCVIWNGPDIPCINLCQGDSIDSVVHQLAELLCESTIGVIDVTSLDFKCIVDQSSQTPDTLLEVLQELINKVCDIENNCCGGTTTSSPASPIPLPACLYFTQNGDQVTQLLPNAYSAYLADRICTILTTIASVQSALTSLTTRVTTVENTLEELNEATPPTITITTQCASGNSSGLTLPIATAFSNFEQKFCQLQSLLGSLVSLTAAINKECPDLDQDSQLCNQESLMSALPGWVATPVTVSDSLTNMWLTICDMRCAVQSLIVTGVTECITIAPSNVQITSLTSTGCTVTWNHPLTGPYEDPMAYVVTITEWNGIAKVGNPVATATVNHPATNHVFANVGNTSKFYIAEVYAAYTCGNSENGYAIGPVRLNSILYRLGVDDQTTTAQITYPCNNENLPATQRAAIITLYSPATGQVVVNTGPAITAVLRFAITGNCPSPATDDVSIVIPTGQSSATYTYVGERFKECTSNHCTPELKTFSCVVSLSSTSVVLNPSVTSC